MSKIYEFKRYRSMSEEPEILKVKENDLTESQLQLLIEELYIDYKELPFEAKIRFKNLLNERIDYE